MLRPVYHLAFDDAQRVRLQATGLKAWAPTLLIPRKLCVFESLPCKGLAWREQRRFAAAQARRLAPFASTSSSAVIRKGRLMLWLWDSQELQQLLEPLNLKLGEWRLVAEAVYGEAPQAQGEQRRSCMNGEELWQVEDQAVVGSTWLASPQGHAVTLGPWGRNLTPQLGAGPQKEARSWRVHPVVVANTAMAALSLAALGYLSFNSGRYWSLEGEVARLEAEADKADSRILQLSHVGSEARKEAEWLDQYRQLASSIQINRLLEAIQPLLERHGVVISEFELRDQHLRLQLVTAAGDIDLPALLDAFNHLDGVADVQLRDNNELTSVTLSMQLPGYRRLMGPASEAVHE